MAGPDLPLKHTPLHALHLELGGRLVPFAGYAMPVQYLLGIKAEHTATRTRAGLFDVSHMGQLSLHGPRDALEALVPSDIAGLALGQQRYTVLTTTSGGILDDLMVTCLSDRLYVVVNAAFKQAVTDHLRAGLESTCRVEAHADRALLALQGPAAARVLAPLCPAACELRFMQGCAATIAGRACLINRAGYTGEDGFEIALAAADAEAVARILLAHPEVTAVGLGARDSLRLEAGLCLSGSDIDGTTSPCEAGLAWVIAKKHTGENAVPARFPGAARILAERRAGTARSRVGLRASGRVPVRAGAPLHAADGREVGKITSGGFGPTVDGPVAMGYVERAWSQPGTMLNVTIRAHEHAVEVVALPFVPHRYHQR